MPILILVDIRPTLFGVSNLNVLFWETFGVRVCSEDMLATHGPLSRIIRHQMMKYFGVFEAFCFGSGVGGGGVGGYGGNSRSIKHARPSHPR